LRVDIFLFIYLFLFSHAELDLVVKSTRLVYKRKTTFRKAKKTTLIVELAPQTLDFGGEPVMNQNDDNQPRMEFAAPKVNKI
jgi:hypothetical protein